MDSPKGITSPHILILDDDTAHQELCLRAFRDDPGMFRVSVAGNIRSAREIIERDPPDLIIADWVLPEGKGLDVLPRRDGAVTIPLIIMTSYGDEHLAVEIMKSGAIDYVVKSATVFRDLPHIARRALRDWENIRERKRAEAAVQHSQKRLADILDFLPDATFAIDQEGRVIVWNRAIEKMTGIVAADMIGKGDHEYAIPFYGDRRPILIDLVMVNDAGIEKKYDYIRRDNGRITSETFIPTLYDGKGAYLWGTASPLYDAAGKRIGAIEVIRDITDRKRAELKLVSAQHQLKEAHHLARIGTWDWVMENDTVTWSEELYNLAGRDPSLPAPSYSEHPTLYTPSSWDRLSSAVTRTLGTGEPYNLELELIRPDGRKLWVNAFGGVKRDGDGKVTGLYGTLQDISDRKYTELALQESEQKYRFLVDNVRDILWQTTKDLSFTYISPAVETLTGYSPAELIGTSLFGILTESSARDVQERLRKRLEEYSLGGRDLATVFEIGIIRKDGGHRWLEVSSNPVFGPDKSLDGFHGISRDISERKKAESALKQSETRFHDLFSNMSAGVAIYDVIDNGEDFVFRDINRAAETIDHIRKDEVVGHSVLEIFPGVKEFGLFDVFRRVAETGTGESHPISQYRDNRITGWRENFVYKLPSGELVAIFEDVTEKKQALENLRESERKFRTLADYTYDWEYWIGPDGRYQYISPSCERITGYSPDAFYDDPELMEKILHPDDRVDFHEHNRSVQNGTGTKALTEFRIIARDGRTVWIGHLCRPIISPEGEFLGLRGSNRDITQRKNAEIALHESETRFRALIQNSSDIIRILNPNGQILYESPSAEQILGYPPGYMIGRNSAEYIHPDDLERVKHDFLEVVDKTNASTPTEFRIQKADGEYIWVDSIGNNLLDVPGVNGIVVTTRPIHQRKLAEEETQKTLHQLERSEALLRNVYDILPIGLWLADKNGKLQYGNPAGVKIWGAEPLVPIEQYGVFRARRFPTGEEIAPDDWALAHTIREGVTIKDEMLEIDAFDGKKKIILNYTAPLYDTSGNIDGAIVANQEITDKVNAERALLENQARLATAMDIASLVNWEYDVASGMFTFDDRFYNLYGTTADQEGGNLMPAKTYIQEFVHPDDREAVLAEIHNLLATTDPDYTGQMEHRITPRDGSIRTIIVRYAVVLGPDGNVIRTYGANQDITDRILMESEIRSLNTVLEQRVKDRTEALQRSNEALEKENAQRLEAETKLQASYDEKVMLLKEIHHRVKNNLQIIASLLNLQSRYISDAQTLAAIRESQNRVKAMALVHEKLYRAEDIAHISFHEYVRFLGTGLFQFYGAKARGIQFTLDIHDVYVDIDAAIPLGLILNELISNSLKYAFPEERNGEVSISVTKEGHTLTVLFRDNGIGIPGDLDWKNTQSLGLRLVNTLVDQMNGTVDLDRSAGTQFTMTVHEKEQGGSTP